MKRKYNHLTKVLKISLITLIGLFFININVNAQERDYKDHSIYLSYGTVIFSDLLTVSLEKTIQEQEKMRIKVKLNYGNYSSKTPDLSTGERIYQQYFGGSGVLVFGIFEMSLGIAYADYRKASGFMPVSGVDYDEVFSGFIFQGNTGIRLEAGELLLRAGVGNRELLYVGVGFNF